MLDTQQRTGIFAQSQQQTREAFETLRRLHPEMKEVFDLQEHFAVDMMGDVSDPDAFGTLDDMAGEVALLVRMAEDYR